MPEIHTITYSVSETGCWIPDGYFRNKSGYAQVGREGKTWRIHKWVWIKEKGPVPDGMLVCHACDNRACMNPGHLFLGTASENAHDSMRKGRHIKGEEVGNSKLSEQQVRSIRKLWEERYGMCKMLAGRYRVHPATIQKIVERKIWNHI